ncbi:MAG TPA: cytochrome c peroxidase [Dokdonella sp.]|nr:cytochrome c peroxidase [Dokdonella sp.]
MRVGVPASGNSYAQAARRAQVLRQAGRLLFADRSLSASGRQACTSCHDPARRYNPPDASAVERGGPTLAEQGMRAPPTLSYLNRVPAYSNHFHESDEEGDESVDAGPTGGLTWDGRVDRGAEQALAPLLAPFEMANTQAGVARAARRSRASRLLRDVLGEHALDTDEGAITAVTRALGAFEEDYDEFSPYTSKYDAYLTGRARLSAKELRGLAAFEDERKGNCASCHRSRRGLDGSPPAFSDYGLIALGVPRNAAIARNADAGFHDLGACGPLRTDKQGQAEYCGLFRTPTLRNVALRRQFFHNGSFHSLRDVVAFYATRDATPERWYAHDASGRVVAYDDLPAAYHANINRDPPFAAQHAGGPAALDAADIDAIVAFLGTLTDGYLGANPYRAERQAAHARASAVIERSRHAQATDRAHGS